MTGRAPIAVPLLVALLGACSGPPSAGGCDTDADCGSGLLCHLGTCAGNVAPSAAIALPAGATTHRLLTLRSQSTDPEGRPLELRWTVEPVDAACEAEPEPPEGTGLDVAFWCPGDYRVTLVALDPLGAESPPAIRLLSVAAASGAPLVTVGPGVSAAHRCDASVPSCEALAPGGATEIPLTAAGSDPGGGPLTWEWRLLPADDADPGLSARFTPGADVTAPTVSVTSPGGRIAGLHRLRARARNGSGLIGEAFQELVVGNAPPTLGASSFAVGHRYADGRYLVDEELDLGAADPDGDPLLLAAILSAPAATGCDETLLPLDGGKLRVRISCATPSGLADSAPRVLSLALSDRNGGTASLTAPLSVLNRPPTVALAPALGGRLSVPHRVEPCALSGDPSCFVADGADPFVVEDPDGDPVAGWTLGVTVASGLPAARGAAAVDGKGYRFRLEAPVGAPAQFRAPGDATGFSLAATAVDPFGATTGLVLPVEIRNSPPVAVEVVGAVQVPHRYDAATRRYVASAAGSLFMDPDGDPLVADGRDLGFCTSVTLAEGRLAVACEKAWDWTAGGRPPLQSLVGIRYVNATVADGWESVASTLAVEVLDRRATVAAPFSSAEACACVTASGCLRYAPATSSIPVPVQLDDPDGDPAQLELTVAGPPVTQPPAVTCLPGWCYPRFNPTPSGSSGGSGTVQAFARDGSADASADWAITATCAAEGSCCGP